MLAEYIEKCNEDISGMYGYTSLVKDISAETTMPKTITENLIAKNLLANHYGNIVDSSLCLHFRQD